MRTEIKVVDWPPKGPPFFLYNENRSISDKEASRHMKEHWMRVVRRTFVKDGIEGVREICVKHELGIFGYRDGDFEIRWKEYDPARDLTEVAPMEQFLVWVK